MHQLQLQLLLLGAASLLLQLLFAGLAGVPHACLTRREHLASLAHLSKRNNAAAERAEVLQMGPHVNWAVTAL